MSEKALFARKFVGDLIHHHALTGFDKQRIRDLLEDYDRAVDLRDALEGIAERVIGHIDTMYPKMWKDVPKTARLSIRNTILNTQQALQKGDKSHE